MPSSARAAANRSHFLSGAAFVLWVVWSEGPCPAVKANTGLSRHFNWIWLYFSTSLASWQAISCYISIFIYYISIIIHFGTSDHCQSMAPDIYTWQLLMSAPKQCSDPDNSAARVPKPAHPYEAQARVNDKTVLAKPWFSVSLCFQSEQERTELSDGFMGWNPVHNKSRNGMHTRSVRLGISQSDNDVWHPCSCKTSSRLWLPAEIYAFWPINPMVFTVHELRGQFRPILKPEIFLRSSGMFLVAHLNCRKEFLFWTYII